MGWLYRKGFSRMDLVRERTRPEENDVLAWRCLRHCLRGNVLWTVWAVMDLEVQRVRRHIGCDLLRPSPTLDVPKKSFGWGYKDMEESMHPYYYTCPLKYLDMVPVESEDWRKGVRRYHQERKENLACRKKRSSGTGS